MKTHQEKRQEKEILVNKLAQYRVHNRLTIKALAAEMDLPTTTVSSWLQGLNMPSDIAVGIIIDYLEKQGSAD
jgi:DNA-binding transcriptional regulator YiaG